MQRIVAVVTGPDNAAAERTLRALPAYAAAEVRADLFAETADAPRLRAAFPRTFIWTSRRREEMGGFSGSEADRAAVLRQGLAAGADYIDVESRSRLASAFAEEARGRLLLSCHALAPEAEALETEYASMRRLSAGPLKLAPPAGSAAEALAVLAWWMEKRDPLLSAFPIGDRAMFGRVLASRLGAPFVYGALARGAEVAAGQPTVDELREVFAADVGERPQRLFGVVGSSVVHSLSPHVHNAGLRAAGLPYLYLPFAAGSLEELLEGLGTSPLGIPLGGLSVTLPFKRMAAAIAGWHGPEVTATGAANTLVPREGGWQAFNTDVAGAVEPLAALADLSRLRAAVVGAGGAASAAAYGLQQAGAHVAIFSRSPERGAALGDRLGLTSRPLAELGAAEGYDILVNATPLGLAAGDALPLAEPALVAGRLLLDMPYRPGGTSLARLARQRGCRVVDGLEMLARQALHQFRLFTGTAPPESAMRAALRRAAGMAA